MHAPSRESAIVILVPEAEPIVGHLRSRLDSGAAWGVPAHITILYPFLPLAAITPEVDMELHALFADFDSFEAELSSIGWFGTEVVHARPEPGDRFVELTDAVHRRWPGWPPYGGEHDEVVPHLTVGDDRDVAALRRAAQAVERHLPIAFRVADVSLFSGTDQIGSWIHERSYPLGRSA